MSQNTGPENLALTARQERGIAARDGMETGAKPAPLVPTTFLEAQAFAGALAESPLMPDALRKQAPNVLVVILAGIELGLTPMQSIRLHHVIEGVPRLSSAGIAGIVMSSPLCEYLRCTESTETRSTWATKRKGEPERSCTWTQERAVKAGLWGKAGPWSKYPTNMLNSRARKELCEIVYPDICAGLMSQEEAEDIAGERAAPVVFTAPQGPPPGVPMPPDNKPKRGSRSAPIEAQATERPTPPATSSSSTAPAGSSSPSPTGSGSTSSSPPSNATAAGKSSPSSKLDAAKAVVEAKRDAPLAAPASSSASPATPPAGETALSPSASAALDQMIQAGRAALDAVPDEPGSDSDEDEHGDVVIPPDEFEQTPAPAFSLDGFFAWLKAGTWSKQDELARDVAPWVEWSGKTYAKGSDELNKIRAAYKARKEGLAG